METPVMSPIRPVPRFYSEKQMFSSKKARSSTPSNRKAPPRPPSKSVPPLSRFFNQPSSDKAQAISFKESIDSSALSRHYDGTRHELYFEQCFEVERKLGSGSFGDVFKVRSREDGKYYAVKRSRERFKGRSDRQRKLQEVAKHEQLPKHPTLVQFYKAWEEGQLLYIQTELCETSLSQFAERNHDIPESLVWSYLADLLMALKHLHEHVLLHLDVKPDNIFISNDSVCKLGDFGLVVDMTKVDLSEAMEGDPKYLAKELMEGKFTKAADIFSLGITILELACDLDLPSGEEGWHLLRNKQIPFHRFNHISPDLQEIIKLMMDPDYERRPSASQLLEFPVIKKVAQKRMMKIKWHQSLRAVQSFFSSLFTVLCNILFVNYFYELISTTSGKDSSESAPKPTILPQRHSSVDWDQSFSDDEILEDALLYSPDLDDFNASNGFPDPLNESKNMKPMNSTPCVDRRSALLNNSPFIASTSMKPREPAPFALFPKDSPALLRDSLLSSRPNTCTTPSNPHKNSFCDFSDDDRDERDDDDNSLNISGSSIGPKNLLSVFEKMGSDDTLDENST